MSNIKTLYTSGKAPDQKLALYQLPELDLTDAIVRVNKVSANGIALTVAVILDKDFESTVSKNAVEKGVTSMTVKAGDVLVFDVNSSAIDDRTKEPNKHCEALIQGLTEAGCMPESIIQLTFDGPGIPSKGISKKQITMNLSDREDSVFFIAKDFEPNEDNEKCIAALAGNKFVERQGYQKKSPDESVKERLEILEKGMIDTSDTALIPRIAALLDCKIEFNPETLKWKVEGTKWTGFVSDFLSR